MSSIIPKVAIILVNYNGTEDTLECLHSLAKIEYPDHEVILVDNASTDSAYLLERVRHEFPLVQVIPLAENTGFSGGNNAGIRTALAQGAEYILLLNNDTIVASDFLDKLVAIAESDEHIGIVGPKIYYHAFGDSTSRLPEVESPIIWYNGGEFVWRYGGKHTDIDTVDTNPNNAMPHQTIYMTGCALLVKKEVIEKIGLLSEDFFMYYEDIDWSLRAKKAGYKIVVAPAAHIWHKVSRSAVKMGKPRIHYYHVRNALLLTQRNAPLLTKLLVYAWSVWHFIKQIIKITFLPSLRPIARAIMRGILDFWRGKYGKARN